MIAEIIKGSIYATVTEGYTDRATSNKGGSLNVVGSFDEADYVDRVMVEVQARANETCAEIEKTLRVHQAAHLASKRERERDELPV